MNIIAAADINSGIGYRGNLLFSIPGDIEFFKNKTMGKTVVMGRKTFDSLRIKPLPGRRNIVLTTNPDFSHPGTETVHSVQELLSVLENVPDEDVFVIGGAEIYRQLEKYCDTAFITKIYAETEADCFITDFASLPGWQLSEISELKQYNGLEYRFITYIRQH